MKMMYNGTQIKSLNVKHFEVNTNDCDMVASDLQAGTTAVARGKKITGTGKCFEFATYGGFVTNTTRFVPNNINVIEVSSTDNPVKLKMQLYDMKNIDFTTKQDIATVTVDGVEYNVSVSVSSNMITIYCDKNITLQVFYGKDNYVLVILTRTIKEDNYCNTITLK